MDFNLKTYKHTKIKHYFKTIKKFYFFQGTSLNNKSWIKIEQSLFTHKLRYFTILNKLTINTLSNSIFKNIITLINGPILILNSNYNGAELTFKEIKNINPLIRLLGFKLNNKIYSKNQIKNLKKISYLENFHNFHSSMKIFAKTPYYAFKHKRTN
jgi:hypothetical protein